MGPERRNPYVILGVPFGATAEQARTGFARTSRRLRQNPDALYTQEDLTWALHQIEQLIIHPELAFELYRIPASPDVASTSTPGAFRPAPHPLPRSTDPSPSEWDKVRRGALAAALRRMMGQEIPESIDYIPYE